MLNKIFKIVVPFLIIIVSTTLTLLLLEILIRQNEKNISIKNQQKPIFLMEISDEMTLRSKVKKNKITEKTFNIYYFGESSMWGEPYFNTIPIMVEKMLGGKIEGKELKWINMAEPGIGFNVVTDRIKQIVDQKNIYFPSLVVIYAGHDEFLHYHNSVGFSFAKNKDNFFGKIISESRLADKVARALKLYKLEIDDRAFFDTPVVDLNVYTEILNNNKEMLQSNVAYLEKNKVPMIISTVAGNYADFDPNRSVFRGDESKKDRFKKYMDWGIGAEKNKEYTEALVSYQKAENIDNKFAETQYRLGKVYQELGQNENAWKAYSMAVDNDMMPIRAVAFQNKSILEIPENQNIGVIDVVSYLREKSDNTLIGNNFFADGHHPNLEGFRLISELFAKKITVMYPKNTQFNPLPKTEAEKIFDSNGGLYGVYISRTDWLIRLATWRYDPSQRLNTADSYLDKAKVICDTDYYWDLSKMTISYLRNDVKKAKEYYEKANKINHKETRAYLKNEWINQIVSRALN
ncbi:MAG: tetratricopeptide repeat protein [Candidatus Shapirobacteria bacterium]